MRLIDIAVFVAAATFSASALSQTRSGGTMAFLDVPQVTDLMYELGLNGISSDLADTHIITEDECTDALVKMLGSPKK